MSDTDKLIEEYLKKGHDFGFSSVDSTEYDDTIKVKEDNVESLTKRLREAQELVMPLLVNLYKTADNQYIKWPNRGPQIKTIIEKLVKITKV